MIVTCEQCETQFQLDDAKVPEAGIRVRCSRCKYAFFVESPNRSDTGRADDLAREALARDSAAGSRSPGSAVSGLEDGESDWQFNEEIDPARSRDDGGDGLAAAREAVDSLLGSSASSSAAPAAERGADPSDSDRDPGFDRDDSDLDDRIDLGSPGPDGSIDLGGSDLDLGTPSPSMEIGAASETGLAGEPAEDAGAGSIDREVAPEASADPASFESDAAPGAASALDDQLTGGGSPDDWELSADGLNALSSTAGTPIGRLSRPVPEEVETPSEPPAPLYRGADGGAFDVDSQAGPGAGWISRVRAGVGWALVGLLCAYAGVVGLWPRVSASEPALGPQPIAGLAVDAVRGRWIENAAAGWIYVVSGELRAGTSSLLPAGSVLRVRLLNANGAPIAAQSAAVGPPVSAKQLRQWDLRDLQQRQEAAAHRLAWDPLAAGERQPFHAILGRLPPNAAAFEFQVTAAASPAPELDPDANIPYPPPPPPVAGGPTIE